MTRRHRLYRWLEARRRQMVIGLPLIWMGLFFLVPFVFVLKISFSEAVIARPPYTPLLEWTDQGLAVLLNFGNYAYLIEDTLYLTAYLNSIRIAAIATLITLAIGYPMAYAIARASPARRAVLLVLIILPFWTSFLIRVYAWIGILDREGLLNAALTGLGLIDTPLVLRQTEFAVQLGIVYSYLPFMVLPLFANLEKHDPALLEAAADLGCPPWKGFLRITLPLSLPGIAAGSLLVFIPAVGEFIIPELLGGPDTLMIGRTLWNEFFANRDWPVASAVAIAMLIFLVVPIMWFQHLQGRREPDR